MNRVPHRNRQSQAGFTLVEVLVVVTVVGVLLAASIPVAQTGVERLTFNSAAREVGAEIRAARYAAVAKNRTEVLRFNCPNPREYRMVEFTATAAIDDAADRCSSAVYPYPDPTPGAAPDTDGPVRYLPQGVTFSQSSSLRFDATGRIPAVSTIEITNGRQTRTITVLASDRVVEQ